MRRVMIVTNSLTGGGAERSMNLVGNELTKRGWTVALVPINSGEPDLVAPLCQVFPLYRDWQGGFFNTLVTILKFNMLVRYWKPNFIIMNCDLPELFGAILLRRARFIVVEHTSRPWASRQHLGKIIRRILALRRTCWIAVSAHLRIWPTNNIPHYVIQNPLVLSGVPLIHNSEQQLLRIVFVGRLSKEKGVLKLIEIAEKLNLPVVIIGEGPLRKAMQTEVSVKKLDFSFSGQQLDPWNLVELGDLLLVPSAYEGDGLVVMEAMHRNIPILMADITDFRRFGFSDVNYCTDVSQYIKRISEFQNKIEALVIPEKLSESLLSARTLQSIGDSWERLLS